MPWVGPPPEVRRRVEDALGDSIWRDLDRSFQRIVAIDPGMRLTQWYRSPEEIERELARNPNAARYTQHGVALAVDITPTEPNRPAVIREAQRQGFTVRTYRTDRHLHVAALPDLVWSRSPLQAWLRATRPRVARRE